MSHRARIVELAAALEQRPAPEVVEALDAFAALVESWNTKMNLTAARQPAALVEVLFADALMLASGELIPDGARVIDVGSGAGAPAIPLASIRADVSVTCVEPLHKRVAFMRYAVGSLGLAGRVAVMERKLEVDDAEIEGGPFDVAMSRATLAPADWLALALPRAERVLLFTAADAPPSSERAVAVAHVDYALPSSGAKRRITAYQRR